MPNPEGIRVNSRGRALRDAHGGPDKDSDPERVKHGAKCDPFRVRLSLSRIRGIAQRSPTAINLHPSGMKEIY